MARRWRLSLILTAALFVVYYGFILLVAVNKPLLVDAHRRGDDAWHPARRAVIVLSWALTAAYVAWANVHYDPEAARLRDRLRS